jgi:hypothetical protein
MERESPTTQTNNSSPAEIARIFELLRLVSDEERACYRDMQQSPLGPEHRSRYVIRLSNSSEPMPQTR